MKTRLVLQRLERINLFKQNFSLKFNNPDQVSSSLGTFLSICIIIFLLYNFFSSDMVQNVNPIVLYQSLETKSRSEIRLNKNNFALAFGITDISNNILTQDPTIFNFNADLIDFQLKNNTENAIILNTSLCTQQMFSRFPNEYLNLALSNASCISSNEKKELFLKGWWDEESLSFVRINLKKCKNETDPSIVCQSPENINEFFRNKFFSFWVEQKNIDMTNYQNPISSKIKNFYQLINANEYREINFFLKKTIIKTDDAPIYSAENILESYQHEGVDKASSTDASENLITFLIYSGASTQIFQRNYQKLFDLLANLGGILGALTTIFSILINIIFDWKVNEFILNKLYFLNDQYANLSNRQKKSIFPFSSNPSKISKKKEKINFFPDLCESIKLLFRAKRTQSDNDRFVNKKKEKTKLYFTFWEWMRFFFKKKRNRTKKESVYSNYIKLIYEKLDLIKILQKLEEIDKMKYVLFNDDQLSLFNNISKKNIYCSDNKDSKENHSHYHTKQSKLSQSQISKIRSNFQKIDVGQDNIDSIDRRLMQLFID